MQGDGARKSGTSVNKSKGDSLRVFFTAKTHKQYVLFRTIVSERGTWQNKVSKFLQSCLKQLDLKDPFETKNMETVISSYNQTKILAKILLLT